MAVPDEILRYCETCGRQGSPEARYCGGCGQPFDPDEVARGRRTGAPAEAHAASQAPGAEGDVLDFRPLAVRSFAHLAVCVLTIGIGWVVFRILRLYSSYRITTQRIEIRTGFLTVTRRSVELYRVQDMEVREPLFLRLRSSGDLVIRSMDVGEPTLLLDAVPDVHHVHETLRRLVADERRRTHVRLIEDA